MTPECGSSSEAEHMGICVMMHYAIRAVCAKISITEKYATFFKKRMSFVDI